MQYLWTVELAGIFLRIGVTAQTMLALEGFSPHRPFLPRLSPRHLATGFFLISRTCLTYHHPTPPYGPTLPMNVLNGPNVMSMSFYALQAIAKLKLQETTRREMWIPGDFFIPFWSCLIFTLHMQSLKSHKIRGKKNCVKLFLSKICDFNLVFST